jgi:hypothetical protein
MNLKIAVIIFVFAMAGGIGSHAAAQTSTDQLSEEEAATLVWMREEEKLARDTYITLYQRWGTRIFNNISRSEQKHMDALLTMVNTYGMDDPVSDDTVGAFTDPVLDGLYDQLVENGSTSALDALYVGGFIEELDIKDLWEAIEESTHADITAVYESLLAGSYKHLNAFVNQIEASGIDYQAQYLEQSEVDAILGQSSMTAEMADGSWIVSGHNGEGMIIDITVDEKFVLYWFTYDEYGNQMWMVGVAEEYSGAEVRVTVSRYSGPVFGPGFNSDDKAEETWGEVHINFRDCAIADVSYQSVAGFGAGNLEIERIYYVAGSLCQPE